MKTIALISLGLAITSSFPLYAGIQEYDELEQELSRQREERKIWIEAVSKQQEDNNTAAGIVSVVTHEEIERYGGKNLFDVLNRVTSVYMTGSHLWTESVASVRGDLSSIINNHTLVLLNGRPLRDSLQGGLNQIVFRDFPIHQIEQIEVIRGSGSVLYGTNAFSAVINIVTKKNNANSVTLRGRYGSGNTGQTEGEFS